MPRASCALGASEGIFAKCHFGEHDFGRRHGENSSQRFFSGDGDRSKLVGGDMTCPRTAALATLEKFGVPHSGQTLHDLRPIAPLLPPCVTTYSRQAKCFSTSKRTLTGPAVPSSKQLSTPVTTRRRGRRCPECIQRWTSASASSWKVDKCFEGRQARSLKQVHTGVENSGKACP